MKAVVTGSRGQLGRALLEEGSRRGVETRGFDLPEVDIRDGAAVEEFIAREKPDWVFHCAARTDVDGCEKDRDEVFRVNLDGPLNVLAASRNSGARFLLVSTDFVFDGRKGAPYTEEDPVNPLCVYGLSKAEAEKACLGEWPEGTWIARTQWLYGPGGRHFPGAILKKAAAGEDLRVVDDQVGCPTLTTDLAGMLLDLASAGAPPGIYHASNEGRASWFEFAQAALEIGGFFRTRMEPVSSAELDLPASRPAFSVLSKEKLKKATGAEIRPWKKALEDYLVRMGGLEEILPPREDGAR